MEKQLKQLKKAAEALLAEMKDLQDTVTLMDTQVLNGVAPLPTAKRSKRKGLKREEADRILEGITQASSLLDGASVGIQTEPAPLPSHTPYRAGASSACPESLPESLGPSLVAPSGPLRRQPSDASLDACSVSCPCFSDNIPSDTPCSSPSLPLCEPSHKPESSHGDAGSK